MAFLHEKGIVHRDIKPDNLVFESRAVDSPIKLIDFGYAGHCECCRIRARASGLTRASLRTAMKAAAY